MITEIVHAYCRAVRWAIRVIGHSVSYLMPILALVVAYEVFARYILDRPTLWAYDTSLFLFGYIAALGGALAQQKSAHINVDIVHGKVSLKMRRLFDVVTSLLAMFFLTVMAKTCFGMFVEALELGYKTQSEWAPHTHHFWLMVTVSAVIFIAQYSTELLANLYYLVTGTDLVFRDHDEGALNDQPFKVDLQQQHNSSLFDKESTNGN